MDVEEIDRGVTQRPHGLLRLSQTNVEIVPQIMPQSLPSKSFPIHNRHIHNLPAPHTLFTSQRDRFQDWR
jgi:hypothetical protein